MLSSYSHDCCVPMEPGSAGVGRCWSSSSGESQYELNWNLCIVCQSACDEKH
jgi:hypothetical protein